MFKFFFFPHDSKRITELLLSWTSKWRDLGFILRVYGYGCHKHKKDEWKIHWSTEGVAKTIKELLEDATLPNIKDFLKPRVRNEVENEVEAKLINVEL